jgi:dihydrofolate reductase/thymidylate synthase
MDREFSIIAAFCCKTGGIGIANGLPWSLPEDLKRFKQITSGNVVIMGLQTFTSLGRKPLPGRLNLVLSTKETGGNGDRLFIGNLANSLAYLDSLDEWRTRPIFIIGGESVYRQFIYNQFCMTVYATRIESEDVIKYDRFFPIHVLYDVGKFKATSSIFASGLSSFSYIFVEYRRVHAEMQYLDLVTKCIESGTPSQDGKTLRLFGEKMEFDLSNGCIPVLTTKRIYWKSVVEELLWFIRGETDAATLSARGVHIWDANAIAWGSTDLGPIYGKQWRNFGGVDQLSECVRQLRESPDSRRIVMSAWNPPELSKMALPPCHMICQFTAIGGRLNCALTQRSGDIGLGIPFNIASYALLTHLIAIICGLQPGKFVHFIGDAHIYADHVKALRIQTARTPFHFPRLQINGPPLASLADLENPDLADLIKLVDYRHHNPIKMKMII